MTAFLQFLLLIIISTAVWLTLSICASICSKIIDFQLVGHLDIPVSSAMKFGTVVGVSHGIIGAFVILLRKSDSYVSFIISNIIAFEIFLLIAFILFYVNNMRGTFNSNHSRSEPISEILSFLLINGIFYYLLFSIISLIPTILIGIMEKKSFKLLFG